MRTTIRIDENLLAEAKKLAADSRISLTALIEDALKEILHRNQNKKKSEAFKLVTFKGKGLQPGVDLDDSASLLELMDQSDAPL